MICKLMRGFVVCFHLGEGKTQPYEEGWSLQWSEALS